MIDLSIIALVLVVPLLIFVVMMAKKQGKLSEALEESQQEVQSLREDMKALYNGAAGVGSQLARIESHMNSLSDRQEQIDVRDPTTQNYNVAIELVHQGAGVEELMNQCGLLMEEAELLVRLHGSPLG